MVPGTPPSEASVTYEGEALEPYPYPEFSGEGNVLINALGFPLQLASRHMLTFFTGVLIFCWYFCWVSPRPPLADNPLEELTELRKAVNTHIYGLL